MANTMPLHEWLRFVESEYLSSFIRDGGASIKFAVTQDGLKPALYEALESRCRTSGYVVVKLDALATRAHMPQDIFFGMANQVDWRLLARRLILKLAQERGYRVDHLDLWQDRNPFTAIGESNALESESIYRELRPFIDSEVAKNRHMAKDFRVAMSHFCQCENTRGQDSYVGQPLIDWLTGAVTRVSHVKSFSVYTGINRTTARHFIESALYWFRYVGYAGTVILFDNARVTLARNPKDGFRHYTRAMAMDHYEVLREFVDATDRLTGALMVVVTNNEFLDETGPKGYHIYQALMTRIMDDVHDKNQVNPMASLVRLS
jgi:hypothetical protein